MTVPAEILDLVDYDIYPSFSQISAEDNYRQLKARMEWLDALLDTAVNDKDRLYCVNEVLMQIIYFLMCDPEVTGKRLLRPLFMIHNALHDAERGSLSPLLNHSAEKSGRPSDLAYHKVQGYLAWMLELRMKSEKISRKKAAEWVANEARRAGISDPYGAAVTKEQVIQWRTNINRKSKSASAGAITEWEAHRESDRELLQMPPSDIKRERIMQYAAGMIRCLGIMTSIAAPAFHSED